MKTFVECVFFLLCSTALVSGVSFTPNEGDHKFYTSGSNGQPGTEGTEFIFNFPQPGITSYPPTVMISTSSIYSVSVNVSVPGVAFHSQTSVDRNQHAEVILPSQTYLDLVNYAQDKTVIVTSDGDVSVHGMTSYGYLADGFMALPTRTLGKKYLIITYSPYNSDYSSEISVSALEDATNVQISLPDASQSLNITLNEYQSYQVFDDKDLTGSIVVADKPIAVLAGVELADVNYNGYINGLFEQLPSTKGYGTHFVLAPFYGRLSGYLYRVICPSSVTISVNGLNLNITAGKMYEGDVVDDSITIIQSNKPILVVQFMKDYITDSMGSPGMVIVPPVEMFSGNVTFAVYDSSYSTRSPNINIIAHCSEGYGLMYDDAQYVSDFDTISLNDMCAFRSQVSSGTHSVTHNDPTVTFAVVVFNYAFNFAYIYLAGYNLINDGHVRLVEGSNVHEGRVEVYHHGDWGTVCDDSWHIYDGNVVCKQLGYDYASNVYGNAYFGAGSGPILLDNVGCVGNEPTLSDCYHNGWGVHNCVHNEDAGVRCEDYPTNTPTSSPVYPSTQTYPWEPPVTTESTPPNSNITAELECQNNTMVVYIPKTALGDISADELSLIDDNCVGEEFNTTHYRVSSAFGECGTTAEVDNGHVVVSNIIMTNVQPVSPGLGFTRDQRIEIPIQCYMSQYGQGEISFHPDTSKIIFHEEGFGEFSFQLRLYPNSAYTSPYPPNAYPLEVHLKERLYFEARVEAQNWLQLFVDSCVATQTTNPYSNPHFEFINNGCSYDDTLEFHASSDPLIRRFSWEALGSIDTDASIYVHCFLMLCNATDSTSRCSRGCQQSLSKRDVSMRGSGSKSYLMTQGPLMRESPVGNSDSTTSLSGGLLIFFAITTIALVIGIVLQKIRNDKKSSDGYKLVPTNDGE